MTDKEPPGPPDEWAADQGWRNDSAAKREASSWPDESALKGTKDTNTLRILKNSGVIAVILMWIFAFAFVASLAVWLIHFLTPWIWLDPEQLSKIQTVIFSGSLGAVVTAIAQKHISKDVL